MKKKFPVDFGRLRVKSVTNCKLGALKKTFIVFTAVSLFFTACKKDKIAEAPASGDSYNEGGKGSAATKTTGPATVSVYPVRAAHNTGWDSAADQPRTWLCDGSANSNSDYGGTRNHLGIDIGCALNAPVAATVSGTIHNLGFISGGGNRITIKTSTGWYHYFAHLNSITPGLAVGQSITAGTIIGRVGNTGTLSNGIVHLHYSIYPDGNYDAGIDPHPLLTAVDNNTCDPNITWPSGIFENFSVNIGRFYRAPAYSGSTVGIATSSTASRYQSGSSWWLRVTLNDNTADTSNWFVRLLSADGNSWNNVPAAKTGTLYYYIKTNTARTGATARLWVDDSDGTEQSAPITIINDNAWHKYSWNLSGTGWTPAVGGNGVIDASQVTVDALILSQPNTSVQWVAYIDDVGK